ISVDLPAPFSPAIAWISPRRSSKLTPRSARIGPNDFVSPVILRIGSWTEVADIALVPYRKPWFDPRAAMVARGSVLRTDASARIASFHVFVQIEGVGVVFGDNRKAIVDERNAHRIVARDLVVVERVDQLGVGGHERRNEARVSLNALVGIEGHVDVAGLDVLQRRRRHV